MGLGGLVDLAKNLLGDGGSAKADPSTFEIRELGGQERSIKLQGRGLPERPFELTTTQRMSTTWLPGYSEGTATLLGPAEEPTTARGFWKDRFIGKPSDPTSSLLGPAKDLVQGVSGAISGGFGPKGAASSDPIVVDGEPVESCRDAAKLFDSLCREGQQLEVSWDTQVRTGHLRRFVKRWHNAHDLEWEMEFEWIGRGERAPAADTKDQTGADIFGAVQGALDDLQAIADEVVAITDELQDAVISQLQTIDSIVTGIANAVSSAQANILGIGTALDSFSFGEFGGSGSGTGGGQASQAGGVAVSGAALQTATTPQQRAADVLALLGALVEACDQMAALADQRPYGAHHRDSQPRSRSGGTMTIGEANATGGQGPGLAGLPPTERLVITDWCRRLRTAALALRAEGVDRGARLAELLEEVLQAVHVARAGEDLRDVARTHYGSALDWRRLLLFNNLNTTRLVAGQVVLVPAATAEGGAL